MKTDDMTRPMRHQFLSIPLSEKKLKLNLNSHTVLYITHTHRPFESNQFLRVIFLMKEKY